MPDTSTISPHKSKGRPRSFDRTVALERALDVFWRRGYEPASISELCAAMEINPPSLYAAFGNKAQLFMEAVQHYEATYWDAVWERMAEEPDFHRAISDFFKESASILTAQDVPCGCLVILAATNVSDEAEDVNAALQAMRQEGRDLLLGRIRRGIRDRQIPRNADASALATALNTMLEGMSLAARDGIGHDLLSRAAAAALAMLPVNEQSK